MRSAGIRVKLKLRTVLWTDWPDRDLWSFHGISLTRHNRALKREIAKMLRSAPKKHNRFKGHIVHSGIFPMPGVTAAWW